MLTSLSLIFLVGLAMGAICGYLKLLRIIGMLVTGIVLGLFWELYLRRLLFREWSG